MSYQLRKNETPGHGLRRICRQQVELALAIATGKKQGRDTPVHETRKHIKKARAALRLVRKEIGRGLFKRQDHCLRNVARLISEIRDAEVRLQTVRQLQSITRRQKHRSYEKIEQMLMLEMENFMAAFAEWQTQAVPMLERARDEIDNWPIEQFDRKQFRRSVQATYKRGRHALAEAKRKVTAECFHVFRKQAKQLWYQLRILRPVNLRYFAGRRIYP
jgi:CHAD domain-containing protein